MNWSQNDIIIHFCTDSALKLIHVLVQTKTEHKRKTKWKHIQSFHYNIMQLHECQYRGLCNIFVFYVSRISAAENCLFQ